MSGMCLLSVFVSVAVAVRVAGQVRWCFTTRELPEHVKEDMHQREVLQSNWVATEALGTIIRKVRFPLLLPGLSAVLANS